MANTLAPTTAAIKDLAKILNEDARQIALAGPRSAFWKPIETAPHGTRFLVFEGFEPTIESAFINEDGEIQPCSNRSQFWHTPTHWMPLPDEPNK